MRWLPRLLLALLWMLPFGARAETAAWRTAPTVGPNEIDFTLDLDCSGGGLVCGALDAYADTQTATVSGAAELDVDDVADTFQFLQDSIQDLGSGPVSAYQTLAVADLLFAAIPFLGAPTTEAGVTFHTTDPALPVPGLDLATPGDYPFSVSVDAAALADVVGPVDAYIDEIVLPAQSVTLTGTFRVLSPDGGGARFEIRDVMGTLMVSNPTTLLGENVTVNVTADVTLNLFGRVGGTLVPAPALGPAGIALLVAGLGVTGAWAHRRASRRTA